jgi:transposase InsO family protein
LPWKVISAMYLRQEFIALASQPAGNIAALCRRAGISRKTGYKWIKRSRTHPDETLCDRSRRPCSSPKRTASDIERCILELRQAHPAWGARKLKRRLEDIGHKNIPAVSVVHGILVRHDLIDPAESDKHRPLVRFERMEPNDLWQMDFKGHFATDDGRCHPLTVLDDHSRFNLVLRACADEQLDTVKTALIDAFTRYGLPRSILSDNGAPWGCCGQENNWTTLGVWMARLGITLIHGRPHHPQTQGKEERFHRTLAAEVIGTRQFRNLAETQAAFDKFRPIYNHQRPHEALGLNVPASRYRSSQRRYPSELPPVTYAQADTVRKADTNGKICFQGKTFKIGKAFAGQKVAVRKMLTEGTMSVFYCHQKVAEIDLQAHSD